MINRNYVLLWIGKIISQLGDKFYGIALAWWILQKTDSPSIMGLFLLVSALPGIIVGIFAGAFTDRLRKKTILITTDIIRGILVLVISFLAVFGHLAVWHTFAIAFLLSVTTAFFEPAVQSIIMEIVEKEYLPKANSLSQMAGGICTVAGPLLGALSVSILGMANVFLVNSISFFISALLSCFIIYKNNYKRSDENNILQDIREGICFIKNQKQIVLVLKIVAVTHFFLGSLMVLLPFLANKLVGKGVQNLGLLEMLMGVGLISGCVLLSVRKNISINPRRLIMFIMSLGLCFIFLSALQFFRIQQVYIYLLIMAVAGACIACASVFWQSLLQNSTPAHMTGRVFSISSLLGNVSLPVAYGFFGVLLDLSSIFAIMGGCGLCIIGLCFYFSFRRNYNVTFSEAEG